MVMLADLSIVSFFVYGEISLSNPMLSSSLIRRCRFETLLSSPPKPISPIAAVPLLTGMLFKLDINATAIGTSAAGSMALNPPATLTIISVSYTHLRAHET